MSDPTLQGSWYSRGNAPFSNVTTAALIAKSWLWQYKAMLKGEVATGTTASVIAGVLGNVARPVGSQWTCEGSSSAAAFNMTGTDLWTSAFNGALIVPQSAGVNHSWIVLKSPVALGPIYLCIDYCGPVVGPGSTDASAGFIWSYTPFTGGSLTNRPRATISVTGDAEFAWGLNASTPADGHYEAFTSTLNLSSTFLGHFSVNANGGFHYATSRSTTGKFHAYHFAEKAVDAEVADLRQTWVGMHQGDGFGARGVPHYGTLVNGRVMSRTWDDSGNGGTMGGPLTWLFGNTGTAVPGWMPADNITTKFRTLPLYLMDTTNLKEAWRGRIPDMWAVGTPPVGNGWPTPGAETQHVVGDVLVPFAVPPSL